MSNNGITVVNNYNNPSNDNLKFANILKSCVSSSSKTEELIQQSAPPVNDIGDISPKNYSKKQIIVDAHKEYFGNMWGEDSTKYFEKYDEEAKKESKPNQWIPAPRIPTQKTGVEEITFDFNDGCRIFVPTETSKEYRIIAGDEDRGMVFFDNKVKPGTFIRSIKKYYIKYFIIIMDGDKELFNYVMDLKDKRVLIQNPVSSLGDGIAWFSFIERFKIQYQCKLTAYMAPMHIALFSNQYPDINMVTEEGAKNIQPYATYFTGLFFKDNQDYQVMDFKHTGLHTTIAHIFDIKDKSDIPPRVDLSAPRQIKEPYVCIACHGSSPLKQWTNPHGWYDVVKFLKSVGYKVLCMDKSPVEGDGIHYTQSIPWGTEDYTGDKSLQERINILKDADFFIGGSSGLAWLAWCCKIPVVMISGFTLPFNEFYTPYRILNPHVCHGCWNDNKVTFDHFDDRWCPYHKDTPREFECNRLISSTYVINTIKTIPNYIKQATAFIENK